jgi:hypothetical protein
LQSLHFCADKLVAYDSKNDINVFNLDTREMIASYAPPGHVAAVLTDPTLDYCVIGLQNGGYDVGRDQRSRRGD